ncbi:MAG: hypothetical protein EX285_02800 [Thaumarchaeota archaeon]|nr:hypothetical protein [Nitrososphaerota archaeon]
MVIVNRSYIIRNKKDKHAYFRKMHVVSSKHRIIVMIVLVVMMTIPTSYAQFDIIDNALVKITAKSWKTITVVKVENSEDNIYDVRLVRLTLQNGVVKSYKAEDGWISEALSNPNTIQFSADTNLINPGESSRFGIKSDQSKPIFHWIIIDEEGDELGSGTLDVIKALKEAAKASLTDDVNTGQGNSIPPTTNSKDETKFPDINPAIAVEANIIRPDKYVRLLGEGFMPDSRITVLFDGKLIDTLNTTSDGIIKDRIKIPKDAVDGSHQVSVSDSSGRAANISIIVVVDEVVIPFTVITEKEIYKLGDLVEISGYARANTAVSLETIDPAGNSIYSSAVPVDNDGKYVAFIQLGLTAVTGKYNLSATQEGMVVTTSYNVFTETGYQMSIITDKFEYKQGESVIISGQSPPTKKINIQVLNPDTTEIFITDENSDNNGKFKTIMILPDDAQEGKYSIIANTDDYEIVLTFSVVKGSLSISVQTDKNEYSDRELVRISGKGKPNDKVSITIITPKEGNIPMNVNTEEDGTYNALWLIQTTSARGNYQIVVQQGDSRAETFFTVHE